MPVSEFNSYNNFCCHSQKARISWLQEVLGLPVTGKRDKRTVKALMKFQSENGLTPNAVVCNKTYYLLCSELGGA